MFKNTETRETEPIREANPLKIERLTIEQQAQRTAIYNGLLSIFTHEEANLALEKWAIYFDETGSVFNGINSFARDICERLNKNGRHRELVKAINFELMNKKPITISSVNTSPSERQPEFKSIELKPAELKPMETQSLKLSAFSMALPPVVEPVGVIDTSFKQFINTPDFQTFQLLLSKIMQLLVLGHPGLKLEMAVFLNELVVSMPWAEAQQQQMMDVITSGHAQQTRAYKADQLKIFLKHLRSWLGAETSVDEAASLLNQAVSEVDITDAGMLYSARGFI